MGDNYWRLGEARLRTARPDDGGMFYEHFLESPAEVERLFDYIGFPPSPEKTREWIAGRAAPGGGDDRRVFVIEAAESAAAPAGPTSGPAGKPAESRPGAASLAASGGPEFLGYIDVWEADRRTGVFKTGIKMREAHRGKGIAARAYAKVLDYYFNELRYQKCAVYVYDFNAASRRFHEKAGFAQEGVLRRECYTGGEYRDAVYYGLLIGEFNAGRGGR
ncbi:MAG: GNAT N-acetyltransferase [Clostridiales bacterium]|jgi:RimJ/RimL family protein N-acetyltransferase|nr:GNAT N-acetyltransferase [Clostridiales bacterium]